MNQIEEYDLGKRDDDALALIDRLLREEPVQDQAVSAYLFQKRLWLLFRQENNQEIVSLLEKKPPEDAFSALIFASALRNLGLHGKAEALLQKLLADDRKALSPIFLEKGNLLVEQGRYPEAASFFERAAQDLSSPALLESALVKQGIALMLQGDYKKAEAILDKLKIKEGKDPLFSSINAYLEAQNQLHDGNNAAALSSYERSISHPLPLTMLKPLLLEYGYFLLSLAEKTNSGENFELFDRADRIFVKLIDLNEPEEGWIGLGKSFLARSAIHQGGNKERKDEIVEALLQLSSEQADELAFLIQTESEEDFKKGNERYLFAISNAPKEKRARLSLQHGLHLVRWGAALEQEGFKEKSSIRFQEGSEALDLFMTTFPASPSLTKAAIAYVKASLASNTKETKTQEVLLSLERNGDLEKTLAKALALLLAIEKRKDQNTINSLTEAALTAYQSTLVKGQHSPLLREARYLLASSLYKVEDYPKAQEILFQRSGLEEPAPLSPEELFLAANIAEKEGRSEDKRALYVRLYEEHPAHPLAKEAAFKRYTLKEYLSGGKQEMKHLEQFVSTWKTSPRLPVAYYAIGLDYRQDRKSQEGKWVRKKSYTKAIQAFSEATSSFYSLKDKHLIPKDQEDALAFLALNAELETGICNFEIARESKAAKREVYLEYAKDIFQRIASRLDAEGRESKTAKAWPIYIEAKLFLAEAEIGLNDFDKGKQDLSEALEYLKKVGVHDGYYFGKAHYLAAEFSLHDSHYEEALRHLTLAENDDSGLTTEEKLSGAIKKGHCLKSLGRLDDAMNVFSSVVNADAVSSLRVQAMLERAYIYREQNRFDLYRKQLEALQRMGGKWQAKAKQLLEEYYGEHRHQ